MPNAVSGLSIKQVIRNKTPITSGNTSGTTTISSVNPAKTELRYMGLTYSGSNINAAQAAVELTNATTITAYRGSTDPASTTVYWELTEYY